MRRGLLILQAFCRVPKAPGFLRFFTRTSFFLLALTSFGLFAAPPASSSVVYIYDELGRLKAVVDPAGDAAKYEYDAVGNLLGISRYASSEVSVIEFTPNSGPVGTTVTIYGTGFSPTASQNTLAFNGVAATVTSATATQIVTSVPPGATTGLIAVTTPAGSDTSDRGQIFC